MNNFSSRTNWKGGQRCRIVASPCPISSYPAWDEAVPSCSFSGCLCCIITIWVYLEFLSLKRGTLAFPHGQYKKIARHTQRAIAGQKKRKAAPSFPPPVVVRANCGQEGGENRKKVRRVFFAATHVMRSFQKVHHDNSQGNISPPPLLSGHEQFEKYSVARPLLRHERAFAENMHLLHVAHAHRHRTNTEFPPRL